MRESRAFDLLPIHGQVFRVPEPPFLEVEHVQTAGLPPRVGILLGRACDEQPTVGREEQRIASAER